MDNTNSFFKYEVCYWDDMDNQERNCEGITYACDFPEAAYNIGLFYGKNSIVSLKIYIADICQPATCYEFEGRTNE